MAYNLNTFFNAMIRAIGQCESEQSAMPRRTTYRVLDFTHTSRSHVSCSTRAQ